LPTNQESLLDAIALAGGYRGDAKDLIVRVQRSNRQAEIRLGSVLDARDPDFRIYPGDRIVVIKSPRSFSVMGAPGKVEQFPFSSSSVSLAEALAMAGGANPNTGDAKAIFVFRFAKTPEGQDKPVVYHLNMMNAGSFFIAQRFAMHDKDILYVGNAGANQPAKAVQIISQLFAPVLSVAAVTNSL
jgi:polysaccharide export outer membrane protein